jgi:hypothetical protein
MTTKKRVEVQGLGEAPSVKPVDLPGYQYGITQLQAPKPQVGTAKLLKFAGDLSKFGKLSESYLGFRQQEAIREQQIDKAQAAQFQEEQREQDKFNEILIKKQINQTAIPSLEGKAADFINVEKYTSFDSVSKNIDDIINEEWAAYSEALGGDVANTLASKAMWNAVTSKYKQDLLVKYKAARTAYTLNEKTNDISVTLGAMTANNRIVPFSDLQAVIRGYDKVLAKDIPGITKKERSEILINAVKQQARMLDADKKHDAAFRLLDGVQGITVNGAPIFQGAKALEELTGIRDDVVGKIDSVSTQSTAEARDVLKGRLLAVLASNPKKFEDMPDSKIDTLKAAFSTLDPEMSDEEITKNIEQAFGPGDFGRNLNNILEGMANKSDLASKLYFRINDDILSQWEAIKAAGVAPMPLTEPNIKEALNGLRKYAANNPEDPTPWKGYISQEGGRVPKFDQLLEESRRLAAGNYILKKDYYAKAGEALRENLKIAENQVPNLDPTTADVSIGSYLPYSISYIKNELKKEAFAIEGEDPEVRDAKLEELQRTLIQQERERFQGILEASTVDFDETLVQELTGVTRSKAEEKYTTLRKFKILPPNFREQVKTERTQMVSDGELVELGVSLFRHGFDSFDPESYKLLNKAVPPLDARDVKLFGNRLEFNTKVAEWVSIIKKDDLTRKGGEALTEEERKQREIYNGFGIYDEASLNEFANAQNIIGNY